MVTIKDVARLAGVPEKTAARALSGQTMGKRRDAKERAERALKAAAELGYEPSEIAKSLRKGRTKTIGLTVGSISNRYFAGLAETVLDEVEKAGYRVLLELTRWNDEKGVDSLKHLQRLRVEGIFYASGFFSKEQMYLKKLSGIGFPLIMLASNQLNIPSVQRGHGHSLPEAVRYLVALGHKRISLCVWQSRTQSDKLLIDLFRSSCRSLSVKAEIFHPSQFQEIIELVRTRPEAMICNAPYGINHFFREAETLGAYKPDVVGIYDEWNFHYHPPKLTGAILVQSEKQIRLAARELIAHIEGTSTPENISLETKFFPASHLILFRLPTWDFRICRHIDLPCRETFFSKKTVRHLDKPFFLFIIIVNVYN